MKTIFAALGCSALLSVSAFAQAGAVSKADQDFIEAAAQTDMLEVHLGQMAQDQAGEQKVKDYAQMLVTDHTNDYTQVTALAAKLGATVPKGIDAAGNRMIAPFEKTKGKVFDKHYVHDMIAGHEKAIAAYKKEDAKTQNADIKTYIEATLPTLEKHLHDAQDLEKGKTS